MSGIIKEQLIELGELIIDLPASNTLEGAGKKIEVLEKLKNIIDYESRLEQNRINNARRR